MKTTNHLIFTALLILLFCVSSLSFASQHEHEKTKMEDVKKEMSQTYDEMKTYTLEQRDEAVAAAKKKLKTLDANIDATEQKLERGLETMSSKARQETRQTLRDLRQQREKLAEWYGGMVHSSAEAWDEVKKGFADSYDRLKQAVSKAANKYDANE